MRGKAKMSRKKRLTGTDNDIRTVAQSILEEAKKRAKNDMECLTEFVLQEAKVVSRYARSRPFYIA